VTQGGTSVTIDIERADAKEGAAGPLREFENVTVRVRFTDTASNSPVAGGSPAAWIDRRAGDRQTTPAQCIAKVKRFAEGSTFSRTELDLTSYFVVTLNSDPTLTVVDPRFGYGDTRLLAIVSLDGPGEDWAPTTDGKQLFVSISSANEVVAVDATAWRVTATAHAIARASRIALQPDEAYLWVGYNGDGDSGVTVLSPRDMKVVARIPTGNGYHHIAFSEDNSFAFVTNPQAGTVSVIDVRKLEKVKDISVGAGPTWIAYSDLAKAAYVANQGDGRIVAIDAVEHTIRATGKSASRRAAASLWW
jgi:YVTN family beta-propeller protein